MFQVAPATMIRILGSSLNTRNRILLTKVARLVMRLLRLWRGLSVPLSFLLAARFPFEGGSVLPELGVEGDEPDAASGSRRGCWPNEGGVDSECIKLAREPCCSGLSVSSGICLNVQIVMISKGNLWNSSVRC